MGDRRLVAIDCETDPFKHGRVPEPFIWGSYDGRNFRVFDHASELIQYYKKKNVYLFAHNGGNFDFHFLLPYMDECRVMLINGRIVQMKIGEALLRDSYAIMPVPLSAIGKQGIEYWKLEAEYRDEHRDEIVSYLCTDCTSLYAMVAEYFQVAGKKPTLASNGFAQLRAMGLAPSRTSHTFDNHFRQFYYGGRVECFQAGEHHDINLFDINSAYPYAMSHPHAHGGQHAEDDTLKGYTDDEIKQGFLIVRCLSHGAFPRRDKDGITYPKGIGRFFVTGHEYLVALKHRLIEHDKVEKIYTFEDELDMSNYVAYWFEKKQAATEAGDNVRREIAKRMLVAPYGKFAQNPITYMDYKIMPAGSTIDVDNGWQLDAEFADKELHARSVLYKIKERLGDDWPSYKMHYNVATGASITGFTRAHLLDAIATMGPENVIYCDTDCIFTTTKSPSHKLRQDGTLGAWTWEGLADPCYIAGKKLYGLRFVNGPKTGQTKLSHKGSKLSFEEIKSLLDGNVIDWKNEAPTFRLGKAPSFIVRSIRATALT